MTNITEVQPVVRNADGGYKNSFNLGSSSSGKFTLQGGFYVLDAVATMGGGSVTVQRVGPDGSTLISTALTLTVTATTIQGYLSAGQYQITVTTATAVFASLQSVPI